MELKQDKFLPTTTTLADLRGLFELKNSSLNENITLGHVSDWNEDPHHQR